MLKGERLNLLARLEATGAKFELGAPEKAGTERDVKVQLESDPRPGTTLPVEAFLVDRSEPLMFSNALQITGPLPVIASSKLSLPNGMAISVLQDEFPAGYTLTAVLDVKNIGPTSLLRLGCTSGIGPRTALHVGEQNQRSSLQQLSQDQLFLSFDTTDLPAGCSLQATIDNGIAGQSQPFTLAYMTRLPQIDSFEATATTEPNGMRTYLITGRNLEFIEKVGWNKSEGTDVSGLPTPIPQQGQKQSLQVALPAPPSDQAPVFLWLRGEKEGRATTIVPSAGITGTVKPAVTSGT
jgi:hypothetical protein